MWLLGRSGVLMIESEINLYAAKLKGFNPLKKIISAAPSSGKRGFNSILVPGCPDRSSQRPKSSAPVGAVERAASASANVKSSNPLGT